MMQNAPHIGHWGSLPRGPLVLICSSGAGYSFRACGDGGCCACVVVTLGPVELEDDGGYMDTAILFEYFFVGVADPLVVDLPFFVLRYGDSVLPRATCRL